MCMETWHGMGMNFSQSAGTAAAGICAVLVFGIVGCSQKEADRALEEAPVAPVAPSAPVPPKVVVTPARPKATPKAQPTPRPAPASTNQTTAPDSETPAPAATGTPAASAPPQTPAPTPSPEPARDPLGQLVQRGTLQSASANQAEYTSNEPPGTGSPGLYEDAIVLSRLRAELKASMPGENSFADSAKVQAGVVTLQAPVGSKQEASASAVDTALSLPGVKKVIILLP